MLKSIILLSLLFFNGQAIAITLSSTSWDYLENDFAVLTTAGDYYSSSFESPSSAAILTIGAAPITPITNNTECGATNPAWKLSARLSTAVAGLQLRVKRVTNGSGGSVFSGENYVTLNTVAQTFFCGSGDLASIGLQFQVDNLGVEDGYGAKAWTIEYTVETL